MGIIRDSFVIFKNWSDAINTLPEEYQLETYKALVEFGTTGEMPKELSSIARAMLISFSVGMENSVARYKASVENGKLGGRPKKVDNQQEPSETQENLDKPNLTQENQQEPTHNLNVNDNVNVNVNDNENDIKLVKKNKNIFENYQDAGACARVPIKNEKEREPYTQHFKEVIDYCFIDKFKNAFYEIVDTMIEAREQSSTEEGLTFNRVHYRGDAFTRIIANIDCDKFRSIMTQIVYNDEIKTRPLYILGCVISASECKDNKTTKEEFDKFMKTMEHRT